MKGNVRVITELNNRLKEELAAINQYTIYILKLENWGYNGLAEDAKKVRDQEIEHSREVADRIVFLEGEPQEQLLAPVNVGKRVDDGITFNLASEKDAITKYNGSIVVAEEVKDYGTAELFRHILQEEEEHLNYWEAQQAQITQMGIANYLTTIAD